MRAAMLILAMFFCSAVHAAVSPADIAAYRALIVQDARLATAGYKLAAGNAAYCKNKAYNPGWVIHDLAQYPDVDIAKAAFGFEQLIQVAALVKGGPADQAGMIADDGLAGLDDAGLYWPAFPEIKTGYERMASFKQLFAERWAQQPKLPVRLLRNGKRVEVILQAALVCASDFQIDPSSKLDAGAQGNMVSVTSALAEYAAAEDELAAIVAHELAHNILGHRARLDAAKVNRGFGRSFGKSRKAILATEVEADKLSIWLLANAGYDPSLALAFWQRYRSEIGTPLLADGTHLSWSKRIAIMQGELEQITATPAKDGKRAPPLLSAKQP